MEERTALRRLVDTEARGAMYPIHQFHQELARARYADMLREARMTKVEAALEAELEKPEPFARLRRSLAHRPRLAVRREPRLTC
jgi:hypothetical protein